MYLDDLRTVLNEVQRACRVSEPAMSIIALPQLDGIASLAVGAKTRVYVDDSFPLALKGLADWNPRSKNYEIVLNVSLLSWQACDLEPVHYHECCHCRLGHVSTSATATARAVSYQRLVQKASVLGEDETFYTTVGQARMEAEAEAEARRLRCTWPFSGYRLWRLITQKEVFPWQLYMNKK